MRLLGINLLFLLGFSSVLSSQTLEIFTGPNFNSLYSSGKSAAFETSYSNNMGFTFGVGVENIMLEEIKLRFTLNYDSYGGEIYERDPGYTSSSVTNAEFKKSSLSGGIYPLNFYVLNCIDLNAGLIISRFLNEDTSGRITGSSISHFNSTSYYTRSSNNIKEGDEKLSSTWTFGLQARIAVNLELYDNIMLAPYYSFYLGLTDEFNDILAGTKSKRHYFGVAIKIALKSSSPLPD